MVEFHHLKCAWFIEHEYAIINGQRLEIEKLQPEQINSLLLDITRNEKIRRYVTLIRKNVKDNLEVLRHSIRRFFAPLNNIPDIDDNGNINIEVQ